VPELAWDQLTRGCRLFVRIQWFKTAIEPHELAGENRVETVLIWRKGADSPNIQALRQVLSEHRPKGRSQTKRKG
jgi:hypothetical protein